MGNQPKKLSDIDRFWDLNSLLPQKRPVNNTVRELDTDTVEIEFGTDGSEKRSSPIPSSYTPAEVPHTASDRLRISDPSILDRLGLDASDKPDVGYSIPQVVDRDAVRSRRDEERKRREAPLRTRASANAPVCLPPYLVYEPESSIIKRVAVSKWQSKYNFYEKFASDAARLWDRTSSPCEAVSFFSYVPQYNQLKYPQLKWYLYWRSKVREGQYLRTDYSYILLYIYEIINCPDLVPPEKGVELLCDIWLAYRDRYPRIDGYLCDWLCDYCLINQLPCPTKRLEPISKSIISAAGFKEFYMTAEKHEEGAAAILAYSSNYDWRQGKYITPDNIDCFSLHIRKAFEKVYRQILSKDSDGMEIKLANTVRDAYSGALCVYDMKRCISVDYLSYSRSPRFRFVVTDIIKYCENRVRMALGIKARLKVEEITPEIRRCIDEYFDEFLPPKPNEKAKKSIETEAHEYDRLYEPLHSDFSLERALDIEKKSWNTTEILVSALNDVGGEESAMTQYGEKSIGKPSSASGAGDDTKSPKQSSGTVCVSEGRSVNIIPDAEGGNISKPENSQISCDGHTNYDPPSGDNDPEDEFGQLVKALDDCSRKALRLLLESNPNGLKKAAEETGQLAEAIFDRINESAFDIIGDSIIEPADDGCRIIKDYEDEIRKWLK